MILDACLQPEAYTRPIFNWGHHPSLGTGTLLFYEYPFLNEKLLTFRQDLLRNVTTQSIGELLLEWEPDDSKRWVMGQQQRKRWLSRAIQKEGIPVWADLTIREDCANLAFYGIPDGWRAYSIRKPLAKDLLKMAALAQEKAGEEILLVVYGGSWVVQEICRERGWHFEPEWSPPRKMPPSRENPLRRGLIEAPQATQGRPRLLTVMM